MHTSDGGREARKQGVSLRGYFSLLFGLVLWALVALGIAYLCRGMVSHSIIYGFFISTVFVLPFLFPSFFGAIFWIGDHSGSGKKGGRRRR